MQKKIFLASALLLLIGAGCELLPSPDENPSLLDLEEQAEEQEQEQEKENIVSEPVKEKPIAKKALRKKEYILNFSYPENYKLEESTSGNEKIKITENASGEEVGEIDIKLLETEQWEDEKYDEVTNEKAVFAYTSMVDNKGTKWSFYYQTNNQGHLFTIGCLPAECPWVLEGISFDETLGQLNKDFLAGNWISDSDEFKLITLYADGGYYSFLENNLPYDAGDWNFDGKTLILDSSTDTKFDKTFTNLSIGEGGDWIMLYEGDETQTWRME